MSVMAQPPAAPLATGPPATAAGPAAVLEKVRKRFGYRDVLRGVSLEIPRGGCFVITGPNGAGKSTIVRLLTTQWSSDAGRVVVCGHDVRKEPAAARARIGVVLHESFLRRELSLEENLRLACDLRGLRWAREAPRLDEILRRLKLDHRRRDPVATFSQGMVKRSSLVRSLVGAPELWILDEPFSGLDPAGRESLMELIAEVGGRGTVLLVTHEIDRARRLATAAAHIADGLVASVSAGTAALQAASRASEAEP